MEQVRRLTNLTTGVPVHGDVRDGRILRMVPLELDEGDGPSWIGRYPLQLISPHPILRLNAADAAARGIAEGELIRASRDRGDFILASQVTGRVPPGTVHAYESVADHIPLGEPGHSPDIAGCVSLLSPKRFVTPTSTGTAPDSCLLQVEKWERGAA